MNHDNGRSNSSDAYIQLQRGQHGPRHVIEKSDLWHYQLGQDLPLYLQSTLLSADIYTRSDLFFIITISIKLLIILPHDPTNMQAELTFAHFQIASLVNENMRYHFVQSFYFQP